MKILIEESVVRQALEALEDTVVELKQQEAIDNLRVAIEQYEAAEPVAVMTHFGFGPMKADPVVSWLRETPSLGTKLYTHPAPSIPEGWKLVPIEQMERAGPVRQYYYKVIGCPAKNAHDPSCICWHSEGTGPMLDRSCPVNVTWRTTRHEPSVPEGWKLVPIEQMEEMLTAGRNEKGQFSVYQKDAAIGRFFRMHAKERDIGWVFPHYIQGAPSIETLDDVIAGIMKREGTS